MHAPSLVDVWQILTDDDRRRLTEIDETETEILDFLRTQPVEDVDAPLFSDLQVERLRVYRAALERTTPGDEELETAPA